MDPLGFANDLFVIIHGHYYRTNADANEHRRPILLQAWYTEFVDVFINEVIRNPKYGITAAQFNDYNLGAHDIFKKYLNYLNRNRCFFVSVRGARLQSQVKTKCNSILKDVKGQRNTGTHEKIRHPDLLSDMLRKMIEFCDLLLQYNLHTQQSNDFKTKCELELANMGNQLYLY